MPSPIEGRVLRRGDYRYENLRREACWHAGVPERYPEVIVLANNESDVVGAVELARDEGMRIAARSGGHSWSGSHLRDGSLLIDVSNLRHVSIDKQALVSTAQPGIRVIELVLPYRPLHKCLHRRIPSAGRFWLGRPPLWPGLHVGYGHRCGYREWRAGSCG
jgi:FAD binding domain